MLVSSAASARQILTGLHDVMASRMAAQAKLNRVVKIIAEAMDLADDFRAAVESLQIAHQASPLGLVTVSMGIAAIAGEGEDARLEAIERARSALERAQACGPNHVLAAGLALV